MRLTKFLAFGIVVAGMFAWAFAANAANIDETAANSGQCKGLVASVQAADLGNALSGPGTYTVFAPTDEAFALATP